MADTGLSTGANPAPTARATPTRREAYEARMKRRSLTIAVTSTLAVFVAFVLLVPFAPGWEAVQRSFFNGQVFARTFPGLLNAFLQNVMIFAWCRRSSQSSDWPLPSAGMCERRSSFRCACSVRSILTCFAAFR